MRKLFFNTLRFLSAMENQQDATKSGRFDEVVDSQTLNFFTYLPIWLIATEIQELRFSPMARLNLRVCNT